MNDNPPEQYRLVARQFRSAGLRKYCAPITLMILLDLTLPQAVATCSLKGGYLGYARGTRTRRALRSLGMTLSKVPVPAQCRSERNQLALVGESLVQNGYSKGKYVVLSKRRRSRHRATKHASAVIDGRLFDWTTNSRKGFRVTAIYRVQGNLDAAKRKARRLAASIPLCRQPLARKPLAKFCTLFVRHHALSHRYQLQFRHASGRRKRSDTLVEWYPLMLHCQPRSAPGTNVRSFLQSVHDLLSTDLTGLRISLVDRCGTRIHGNRLVEGLTRNRPRARAR